MNYSFRNQALWRWCLTTFVVSLVVSLASVFFEPWGWVVPVGLLTNLIQILPSWLAWLAPRWLDWPLTNVLFVLAYVWAKTNRMSLLPLWEKHPPTKLIRAFLQGVIVACFCSVYSLPFLLITPIVLSTIISLYFDEDFSRLHTNNQQETWDDYDDDEGVFFNFELPKYWLSSTLIFFYTILVFYGLYSFGPTFDGLEILFTLVGAPIAYAFLAASALFALLLLIVLLALLIITVGWTYKKAKEYWLMIWEELCFDVKWWGEVFTESFILMLQGLAMAGGFVIVVSVLTSLIVSGFWHWIFPPRPATS